MPKSTFLGQLIDNCNGIVQMANKSDEILLVWTKRGYASGSADPVTQADVDAAFGGSSGITVAQIQNYLFLLDQFNRFRKNQSVTQGDYDATLQGLRTDI